MKSGNTIRCHHFSKYVLVTLNLLQSGMGSKMKSGNTIRCHHFSKYVLVTLYHQNTGLTSYKRPILNIISFRMNVIHGPHLLHEPKPISFQTSIHHSLVSDEYPLHY